MCSLICSINDCSKKLLCNQCMLKHNPQHYPHITPLHDIEYQIGQVPQLIERDLEQLKTKLFSIQNHIGLEKDAIKRQALKMTEVLKSRLTTELDEFLSTVLEFTNKHYSEHESNLADILQALGSHLSVVAPYATRVRPVDPNQFQIMLDFQEKMLTNIMPTLSKKVEVIAKYVPENGLKMRVDNFYAIFKTYLHKALQCHNLFNNNEMQLQQKMALNLKLDEGILPYSKSEVFIANSEVYKKQAAELLRDHRRQDSNNLGVANLAIEGFTTSKKQKTERTERLTNPYSNQNKYLNTILTGHQDIVTCICVFSQTQVISGGGGSEIKIWDIDSGIALGTLTEHAGDVWALAKINEINFASGSSDKTVRIWNISRMCCESLLVGHLEPVRALIYMKDLDYLASGSMDMSIKIWAAGRAKLKNTMQDSQRVRCLCYIEIKGLLMSGGDGRIKVYNVLNGNCRDQLEGHNGEVHALRHLQDTYLGDQISLAASGGADKKVIIWNVDKGLRMHVFTGHGEAVTGLAYDIMNTQLWSVGTDRSCRVWDLIKAKVVVSVRRHSEQISCIEYIVGRELVVTGSWDHRIRVTSRQYFFT